MTDDRPQIELDRASYRRVFDGPLANPQMLKLGIAFFGAFTLLGIWGAWQVETWWSGVFPVPFAMMIGICVAGLDPGYWFRAPKPDITAPYPKE